MPMLGSDFGSMFGGGDYGDQPSLYPNTSFMGMLTGTEIDKGKSPWTKPAPPPPAVTKTVSLEGGHGPGRPSPAPDTGPISGRSQASSAPLGGATGEAGSAASSQDQTLRARKAEDQPSGFGNILNKIGDMINTRSGTLMALGAGFAGAQSPGLGASRALQLAGPAMQQDIAQEHQNATAQALVNRGLPPDLARAAVYSPEILKGLLPTLFGVPKAFKPITLTDEFGRQHVVSYDEQTGRLVSTGQGGNVEGGGGGGSSAVEKAVEATKQYLQTGQIPTGLDNDTKDLLAGTTAYINGEAIPTGNPRQKTINNMVRMVAQRVGLETGRPDLADETQYVARRTMATDLSRSGNSNMGGILTNGMSAFHHLGELSDAFVKQGQLGSEGFVGPAWAAQGANYVGTKVLGGTKASGNLAAVRDTAGHYGQESTKFYSGTGGGEGERTRALNETAAPGTIATDQAAFLEQEKNLMLDRLNAKTDQLEGTLPGALNRKMPHFKDNLQKEIARVDANIARLRGGETGAAKEAPAAPVAPAPKVEPPKLKPGQTLKFDRNGNLIK